MFFLVRRTEDDSWQIGEVDRRGAATPGIGHAGSGTHRQIEEIVNKIYKINGMRLTNNATGEIL